MSWLGLVDDVIKVALNNGDDVTKILATRTGNSFGDELIKGLYGQRSVGRAVRQGEIDKLAQGALNTIGGGLRRTSVPEFQQAGKIVRELGEQLNSFEASKYVDDAIRAAKEARQGEGIGGTTGRLVGRLVNRGEAMVPGLKTFGTEGLVQGAMFGIPSAALGMLIGSGSSNQVPQLTQEQLAMLTPEELAQYEAMLMQQGY